MIGGACSTYEERRCVYRVLVWKPNGKRPLGRPRRRWEYNNTMELQEVAFGDIDCFDLTQDMDSWRALENAVMNVPFPKNARNFLTNCKLFSFSRRSLLHGMSKQVNPST